MTRAAARARRARAGTPTRSWPRSSLEKIDVTCFSTAGGPTVSRSAMPWFDSPSAISASTSRSRGVSASSGSRAAPAPEHPRDDLGVERRPALRDRAHGLDEVAEVGDAVLEQVADAARVVADELGHEALDQVLGEHEHADVRLPAPDLDRRPQPVVGEVRRHPDVDHRDVGLVRADLAQQVRRVARLRRRPRSRPPRAAARRPRAAAARRRRSRRARP